MKTMIILFLVSTFLFWNATAQSNANCSDHCYRCTIAGPGKCDECRHSYGLNKEKICEPCGANCGYCDVSGPGACDPQGCWSSYSLNTTNGVCEKCSSGCSRCNNSGPGKCDQCDRSFTLIDHLCKSCASNCFKCDISGPGQCDEQSCEEHFGVNQGQCSRCPSNCFTCAPTENSTTSPRMTCTRCSEHYAQYKDFSSGLYRCEGTQLIILWYFVIIIIFGLILLAIIIAIVCCCCCRRKKLQHQSHYTNISMA